MPDNQDKNTLRLEAKRIRRAASMMLGAQASEDVARFGVSLLAQQPKGLVVAGYWPIHDELDPRVLMHELSRRGFGLALPAIDTPDTPLVFRRWSLGDPLIRGAFGTSEPEPDAPSCVPDIMLVPLLAFDAQCYRLGYGGGYYDRTLAQHPQVKAFGIAFGAQFMDNLVVSQHDWPLQGVITETGVILPRR